MYFRPYHDTLSTSLDLCDGYPKATCSFHFGISFAFYIEVPILVSKITHIDFVSTRHFAFSTARKDECDLRR